MLRPLLLSALSLAVCGVCSASSLYFTGSGTFSATDTPDEFVKPSATFSFTFVVPSNPVTNPTNSTSVSFDVTPLDFTYELNGAVVNVGPPNDITFNTASIQGGVTLNFSNTAEFIFSSSQYFTGTTATPVFSPNTFLHETFTFLDSSNYDTGGATATLVPTPEPSSMPLICGALGLLLIGLRKSTHIC